MVIQHIALILSLTFTTSSVFMVKSKLHPELWICSCFSCSPQSLRLELHLHVHQEGNLMCTDTVLTVSDRLTDRGNTCTWPVFFSVLWRFIRLDTKPHFTSTLHNLCEDLRRQQCDHYVPLIRPSVSLCFQTGVKFTLWSLKHSLKSSFKKKQPLGFCFLFVCFFHL